MKSLLRRTAQYLLSLYDRLFHADSYSLIKARWERKVFKSARPKGPLADGGVNLFFETETLNAISKVGRDLAFKLSEAEIPISVIDTTTPWAERIRIDGPELARIRKLVGKTAPFRKCITIGTVAQPPPSGYTIYQELFYEFTNSLFLWVPGFFHKAHAVCVFSDFCEDLVKAEAPSGFPVAKIRYPFLFPEDGRKKRRKTIRNYYGIPEESFCVFFNFSYGSSIERKNPEATIEAFSRAFANTDDARLVFKTTASEKWPSDVASVIQWIQRYGVTGKTILIDEYKTMEEVLDLTSAMDVYISLHRGEGLGLGMLEAMSLGVPVVASAYGGNMDFTREGIAFLVPCEVVPCSSEFATHRNATEWAKPDIAIAERHLRTIYDHPEIANGMAKKALSFLQDYYSLDNFKADIRSFLGRSE